VSEQVERCNVCGVGAESRICAECGYTAVVIDCGHYTQPAEVAADAYGRPVCSTCAEEAVAS
jgi:hypothetical protein